MYSVDQRVRILSFPFQHKLGTIIKVSTQGDQQLLTIRLHKTSDTCLMFDHEIELYGESLKIDYKKRLINIIK